MDATLPVGAVPDTRSAADRRMRGFFRLPPDGPKLSLIDAQRAFGRSIFISATRCLLTYVALPLLAPLVDLRGDVGPMLGLVLGAISMTAIFIAARRFFAADHKWRWIYFWVGAGLYVLLTVQAVVDIVALAS